MAFSELPIPEHFDPKNVVRVWKVDYQDRARDAEHWARRHGISPVAQDGYRIALLLVDVQNTFCIPEFELFVGGASGTGAVDDNSRLCEFIYRNLHVVTHIVPTMDTHQAAQIFHSIFLINNRGGHPEPYTLVSVDDIENGVWKFNPEIAHAVKIDPAYGQRFLRHYAQQLKAGGKYDLTIWPYHAMLGGIGHALVSSVEEAIFFHCMARYSPPDFQIKGGNPFTENYSVLSPEVLTGPDGQAIAEKNISLIQKMSAFDAVIIAGQAKSHCVAWTIDDLLNEIHASDPALARNIYLLEDCTSPVVIPGIVDYTDDADRAFQRFADAGMHIVRSTDPISSWEGIRL